MKIETRPQTVAAIHDISGVGRCSLTVISPIISALGVQLCPVPTAVLSTHTGGLGDVAMRDLTDFMQPCLEHYKNLDMNFDCIYTGFLSSSEQIDHCLEFMSAFSDAFKVVDPVMGDHGVSYKTYTQEMCDRMGELVAEADMITPNMTEVSMLLSEPYDSSEISTQKAKSMLVKLSGLGPRYVVVTSVSLAGYGVANIGYDRDKNAFWKVKCDYLPVHYPGTGDMYSAVLVGEMVNGSSMPIAMEHATRFLELAVKTTYSYGTDKRFGVMFERVLPYLLDTRPASEYEIL